MLKTLIAALLIGAIAAGGTAQAQTLTGAYLAARHASLESDFENATRYLSRALAEDPNNPRLLESAISTYLGAGNLDGALPFARKMVADGLDSQPANMTLLAEYMRKGQFNALLDAQSDGLSVGTLLDGLARAWALVGNGQMDAALAAFDEVVDNSETRAFGLYHKALALAMVGDFQGADDILSGRSNGPLPATRNGIFAHVAVLSQLERFDDALELLELSIPNQMQPELIEMRAALSGNQAIPFSRVRSASAGLAEAFYDVADALSTDAQPTYTLLYVRIAQAINPDHADAHLLAGNMLDALEQYDLATRAYRRVPSDHPQFYIAEIGRAASLETLGRIDEAVATLQDLAQSHSGLPFVHLNYGDLLRRQERYAEAKQAYDTAIATLETEDSAQWRPYYVRAIVQEKLGDWPSAESDFRKALELSPGQPFVLNYLGYSLVERREKLDEALEMIEAAVEAEPQSGFISDSLGWVLYRLGRYDEAATWMERAVELEPTDPVINDHLGDALWAVGRYREAEFQWKRALSFVDIDDPGEADPDRIRRKLVVGLDMVLKEEGAAPLHANN